MLSVRCNFRHSAPTADKVLSTLRNCSLKAAPTSAQGRDAASTTPVSVLPGGQLKIVTWGRVAVVTMATARQDSVNVTSAGTELTARRKRLVTR